MSTANSVSFAVSIDDKDNFIQAHLPSTFLHPEINSNLTTSALLTYIYLQQYLPTFVLLLLLPYSAFDL